MLKKALLFCLLSVAAHAQALPVFSATGPDAAAYGAAENYPVAPLGAARPQKYLVGAFSHFDQLNATRPVARAAAPWAWKRAPAEITLHYNFRGRVYDLAEYLARHPVTGLLIARDDTILYEHYQYARTDHDRFTSQSMAKTMVSMLVGIALSEGKIHNLDDSAATYLPPLTGGELGQTPLRALLTMTSGMQFTEDYSGHDDSFRLGRDMLRRDSPGSLPAIMQFNTRAAAPGMVWHYKGLDTETLALALQAAIKMPLADYAGQRIWSRIGTEETALWGQDARGQDVGPFGFNATLRDWARFARLLAHDGNWNGSQIIPAAYVLDATTRPPAGPQAKVSPAYGYGYQVWLPISPRRQFALLGVHGQTILVDPQSKLILVHTAVRPKPSNDPMAAEVLPLWNALVAQFGG